jgi:sulfur carrier protein
LRPETRVDTDDRRAYRPIVKVVLNGEPLEYSGQLTVRALLEHLDLLGRRVAVAINSRVIPKSRFDETRLEEGDSVEIIQAVGGG